MRRPVWVALALAGVMGVALAQTEPVSSDHWTRAYDAYFRKFSKRYFGPHFDWRWFKAQGIAESRLDPAARSRAGAVGIMQILPGTYAEIKARNPHFRHLHDPKWNIAAGIFYDRQLYRKWRRPRPGRERMFLTLASYNTGYGGVLRALRETRKPDPSWPEVAPRLPAQTRRYVGFIDELMQGAGPRRRGIARRLAGL